MSKNNDNPDGVLEGQIPLFSKSTQALIEQALEIYDTPAKDADSIGFTARAMVQATLPHSEPKSNEFTRTNGHYSLTAISPSNIGLPYGVIPRLLLCWIASEAVKTKNRRITLGSSLSAFMSELGMVPTGGRWGSITRLRDQTKRLFSCSFSCSFSDHKRDVGAPFHVAKSYELWWSKQDPDQAGLWESVVVLSESFYEEIITAPIPVDLRALKALSKSPMALDIYAWLTHRNSYMSRSTVIPWASLRAQFGADYKRERDFVAAFKKHLATVKTIYPDAKTSFVEGGLKLWPSKTHVKKVENN